MGQANNKITVRVLADGWLLKTRGGSVKIQDLGEGILLAGDWICDGTNPYAAITLYRAGLRLAKALKTKELLLHIDHGDTRLHDFYTRMGWQPTHTIYRKTNNGRNS